MFFFFSSFRLVLPSIVTFLVAMILFEQHTIFQCALYAHFSFAFLPFVRLSLSAVQLFGLFLPHTHTLCLFPFPCRIITLVYFVGFFFLFFFFSHFEAHTESERGLWYTLNRLKFMCTLRLLSPYMWVYIAVDTYNNFLLNTLTPDMLYGTGAILVNDLLHNPTV